MAYQNKFTFSEIAATESALAALTDQKGDVWFDDWRRGYTDLSNLKEQVYWHLFNRYYDHARASSRCEKINWELLLNCLRCWTMFRLYSIPVRYRVKHYLEEHDFSEIEDELLPRWSCRPSGDC